MIRDAGTPFDLAEYRAGRQTPVFFGSALTNFGLEPFLQALVELAPPPQPRLSDTGVVGPTDERFTGFVFKIQANMDPRHRDRVAFVRVCSGPLHEGHDAVQQPAGQAAQGVACLPVLRPRPRDDRRGLCGRHHRPRQSRAVRDRRHAPLGRAAPVSWRAAISGGALRARPPEGHALQAVRRRAAAARGRRADAGLLSRRRAAASRSSASSARCSTT